METEEVEAAATISEDNKVEDITPAAVTHSEEEASKVIETETNAEEDMKDIEQE